MELKDYSTEELCEELKRRNKEIRKNNNKPKYIEVEGVVTDVYLSSYNRNFIRTIFTVEINDNNISNNCKIGKYNIKSNCFKKSTIPKVGDTVILSHRLTKFVPKFNPYLALITKIVKHKEENNESDNNEIS